MLCRLSGSALFVSRIVIRRTDSKREGWEEREWWGSLQDDGVSIKQVFKDGLGIRNPVLSALLKPSGAGIVVAVEPS